MLTKEAFRESKVLRPRKTPVTAHAPIVDRAGESVRAMARGARHLQGRRRGGCLFLKTNWTRRMGCRLCRMICNHQKVMMRRETTIGAGVRGEVRLAMVLDRRPDPPSLQLGSGAIQAVTTADKAPSGGTTVPTKLVGRPSLTP